MVKTAWLLGHELFLVNEGKPDLTGLMKFPWHLLMYGLLAQCLIAAEKTPGPLNWVPFPDARLELCGLPWFARNAPQLWRLPKDAKEKVPKGVWNRAIAPDGGRIRLTSNTSRVVLRVQATQAPGKPCHFDAYVNNVFAGSGRLRGTQAVDLVVFEKPDRAERDITIYLPNNSEVSVLAVGLDADATLKAPAARANRAPVVCYGSSVLQGTGSAHPGSTYPAALARSLNLDFVNLGFGGAGKAEPEVVDLVASLEAGCFILDLGKSYGNQTIEPYARMLDIIRAAHPNAPIFCVTPIYSTKEVSEPGYREKSEALRDLMRQAAVHRQRAGDKTVYVVEGLELFGPADKHLFNDPLHPNDEGNDTIARRLLPIVSKALSGK